MNQGLKLFSLIILIFSISCTNESESEKEKSEKKQKPDYLKLELVTKDSILNSSQELKNYAAVKSALRAIGTKGVEKPAILNAGIYELAAKYAFNIMKEDYPTQKDLLNDGPALLQLKKIYDEKPTEFYSMNEDNYNTILGSADQLIGSGLPIPNWNSSHEHLALTVASRYTDLPKAVVLYEATRINPENIADNEVRFLASLYQSIIFLELDMPYHSEMYASNAIQYLEATKDLSGTFTTSWLMSDEEPDSLGLDQRDRLMSLSLLVRAIAKTNMEDEDDRKKAANDYKLYMTLTKDEKPMSEWVVLSEVVASAINSKEAQENNNIAAYLDHDNLSFSERHRLKKMVQNQEKNKELDLKNMMITGIVAEKLFTYFQQSDFFKDLEKNEMGEGLFNMQNRFEAYKEKLGNIESLMSLF